MWVPRAGTAEPCPGAALSSTPWLCPGRPRRPCRVPSATPVPSASCPGVWSPGPRTCSTALFPGEGSSWSPVGHVSWASRVHTVWLQHPHWPWAPAVWRQVGSRGAQQGHPAGAHATCVSAGARLVLLHCGSPSGPVSAAAQPSAAGVAVLVTEVVAEPTDPQDTVGAHTFLFPEPPVRAAPGSLEFRAPAFIRCHPVHVLLGAPWNCGLLARLWPGAPTPVAGAQSRPDPAASARRGPPARPRSWALCRGGCPKPRPLGLRVSGAGREASRFRVPETGAECRVPPEAGVGRAGGRGRQEVCLSGVPGVVGPPPPPPLGPCLARPEAGLCSQAWRSPSTTSPTAGSWTSCVGAPGACSRTSRTPPPRSSSPSPGGSRVWAALAAARGFSAACGFPTRGACAPCRPDSLLRGVRPQPRAPPGWGALHGRRRRAGVCRGHPRLSEAPSTPAVPLPCRPSRLRCALCGAGQAGAPSALSGPGARVRGPGAGSGLQQGRHRGVHLAVRPSLRPSCLRTPSSTRCGAPAPGRGGGPLAVRSISLGICGNLPTSFRVPFLCTATAACFSPRRQRRRRRVCEGCTCVCVCVVCKCEGRVSPGMQGPGVHAPS